MHIVVVFSNIENSLAFYWMAQTFAKQPHQFTYVFMHHHKPALATQIEALGNQVIQIKYAGKKDGITAGIQLYRLFKKLKPDVVHAHLFDASMFAITGAWLAGIKKRVYTRHHSDFHHKSYKHAVKYDRWINNRATHIVAISENVKEILIKLEHVKPAKIYLIHHGFNLDALVHVKAETVNALKIKYNANRKYPVIGVISRFTFWKGIQYIIPAFEKLLQKHPNALLVLANATGSYSHVLDDMLEKLPVGSWQKIEFEPNIAALYKTFDVFVHVPVDKAFEAFGQVYIEALATGVPSVFTFSGIAPEFIEHGKHAYMVDYCNSDQINEGIQYLLTTSNHSQMVQNGRNAVYNLFGIDKMITKLMFVYEQ